MTKLSNYAENALLAHVLGVSAFTMPADTYLQLHTADAGEDCTSSIAATSTRQLVASWGAASAGAISSTAAASFTAAANETIGFWSLWDAVSAGNPLTYGAFVAAKAATTGDSLTVEAGDITLSFALTALTTYAGNALLEHLVGRSAYTMPTNTYAALHIGDPGTSGSSNNAAETTRPVITWGSPSGGTAANTAAVEWSGLAAAETVTHVSVRDASSAGNALFRAALAASKLLELGGNAAFAIGDFDFSLQ